MVCVKRYNKETIVKKRKNELLPKGNMGRKALFMWFCVFRILGKFKCLCILVLSLNIMNQTVKVYIDLIEMYVFKNTESLPSFWLKR